MMRNFGVILLAGGAAIVGLGFFMRKGEDKPDDNVTPIDSSKATVAKLPLKNPGNLNVTTEVRIATVTAIYS